MEVNGDFDTPAALPPEKKPPLLLDRLFGGPHVPSGDFGKGRCFSAYRESKHDCSVVQPVPQLLYQLSYPH